MKKFLSILFSRMVIVCALILIQAVLLLLIILNLSKHFIYFYAAFLLLSLAIVVWLVSKDINPSVKVPWVIMIMLFPVFGGLFYLFFGVPRIPKKYAGQMQKLAKAFRLNDSRTLNKIKEENPHVGSQCAYIARLIDMPPHGGTTAAYLSPGETWFQSLLSDLKRAEHFIFMEYFIIEEGAMWDAILSVLSEKARDGLDVRVIYDDIGCIRTLPFPYDEKLERLSIKCAVFNPFTPSLSITFNNRDHRKITVIDGSVGYTGGINLADEYINKKERFGHWKDCGVRLEGDAVQNLTLMFLESWNFYRAEDTSLDPFLPHTWHKGPFPSDGYVQPYMDSPLDGELVGETVYMNMINQATQSLYINTPYLIVDNEVVTALTMAAKRGVDVRIVTPHIPDKWYVHMITQAYYPHLIRAGVKIYEYTAGFIHSKTCLADDQLATVGTINLDYRSLYHHYECGVLFYKNKVIQELKEDFLQTLSVCTPISLLDSTHVPLLKRMLRGVIRIFAPLM